MAKIDIASIDRERLFQLVWKNTMVNRCSLDNVYDSCMQVISDGVPGCFIECGVWRGGCAMVMATAAIHSKADRQTWLFDSFEGIPKPRIIDGDRAIAYYKRERLIAPLEFVERELFVRFGFDRDKVVLVKGWFDNTLPDYRDRVGPVAVLRLDADWYESTKTCLDNLYGNVSQGGFVIVDDYDYWPGCNKAVDEFVAAHPEVNLTKIPNYRGEHSGVYFRKP